VYKVIVSGPAQRGRATLDLLKAQLPLQRIWHSGIACHVTQFTAQKCGERFSIRAWHFSAQE
jgi:hypothetical protein